MPFAFARSPFPDIISDILRLKVGQKIIFFLKIRY